MLFRYLQLASKKLIMVVLHKSNITILVHVLTMSDIVVRFLKTWRKLHEILRRNDYEEVVLAACSGDAR